MANRSIRHGGIGPVNSNFNVSIARNYSSLWLTSVQDDCLIATCFQCYHVLVFNLFEVYSFANNDVVGD